MKIEFPLLNRVRFTRVSAALGLLVGLLWASGLRAQSPEEHASHHPGSAAPAPGAMPAAGGGPGAGGMGPPASAGGMMEGMGKMMEGMGKPPPKELYPTLMSLPELSSEQRKLVDDQAGERMHMGTVLMGQALDTLNAGSASGNYATMHGATTQMREGIAQLESGIAARRALAEGRAPREVALAWFKQEMNLSLAAAPAAHEPFGVTPFHLFTMALLVAFAVAMFVLYFLKMRRAAALFGRIEAGKGTPPPGSAPELAGGRPPDGINAPSGGKSDGPPDKPAAA